MRSAAATVTLRETSRFIFVLLSVCTKDKKDQSEVTI